MHEAFRSLNKEVSLPEQPRLEELHDLRNTVQHKGLTPDAATTQFYVEVAYAFLKRFLRDELTLPIEDILSRKHRALIEGPQPVVKAPELIEEVFAALRGGSAVDQIVTGYTILSRAASLLVGSPDGRVRCRATLRNAAVANGADVKRIDALVKVIVKTRGRVLNSGYEPTPQDGIQYLKAVAGILKMTGVASDADFSPLFPSAKRARRASSERNDV